MRSTESLLKVKYWEFNCDIIADDGVKFGIAKEPLKIRIDEFDGTCKIQDLRLFPLKFHPEREKIRMEAINRGRIYSELNKPKLVQMSGAAMGETRVGWEMELCIFTTYGRAMIDAAAFRDDSPNCTFLPSVHRTLEREGLTEDQLLICTPVALGFNFGTKKWGMSSIKNLPTTEHKLIII
jgi:hypothetical protein